MVRTVFRAVFRFLSLVWFVALTLGLFLLGAGAGWVFVAGVQNPEYDPWVPFSGLYTMLWRLMFMGYAWVFMYLPWRRRVREYLRAYKAARAECALCAIASAGWLTGSGRHPGSTYGSAREP